MKRIAYIGLSSPTAYFYDHDRKYFKEPWAWNPILESPQGLITLFDEIWFFSRALCPVNLRNSNFVKFLDENSFYSSKIERVCRDFDIFSFDRFLEIYPLITQLIDTNSNYSEEQFKRYEKIIDSVYGDNSLIFPIDNHSHELTFSDFQYRGNSMRVDLIAFDIAIIQEINLIGLELISNSFNVNAFNIHKKFNKIKISEGVTVSKIPVLQTPVGPVIDKIESLRENKYLVDFRQKINKLEKVDDIKDNIVSIESEYISYTKNVLQQHQNKAQLFNSISSTVIDTFLDLATLSGVSTIKKIADDRNTRKMNWTGFITNI